MKPAEFKPAITIRQQHQTDPLDRAATGIDSIEISDDFL
jgi:hypothetical protein